MNPRAPVDDYFAKFFSELGYTVLWDYDKRGTWHEIYDAQGMICQIDVTVTLFAFWLDLPALMEGRQGTSSATYECRCPEENMERFRELGRRALARAQRHEWSFRCLYTNTANETFELLRCDHCGEEKLGKPRPGEYGAMGPYNVYNGQEFCTPQEEKDARRRASEREWAEFRKAEERALYERQEKVWARAEAAGVLVSELPFSLDEARALYDAGYSSGLERGADGDSFEQALRKLGR